MFKKVHGREGRRIGCGNFVSWEAGEGWGNGWGSSSHLVLPKHLLATAQEAKMGHEGGGRGYLMDYSISAGHQRPDEKA